MRKPRTSQVTIQIGEKRPELYLISSEKAQAIRKQLHSDCINDGLIRTRKFLDKIYSKTSKAGTLIRGLRAREELTQEEFAKKIGCPQSWVSGWETGKRALGKKSAQKIAKIFKVDYRIFL